MKLVRLWLLSFVIVQWELKDPLVDELLTRWLEEVVFLLGKRNKKVFLSGIKSESLKRRKEKAESDSRWFFFRWHGILMESLCDKASEWSSFRGRAKLNKKALNDGAKLIIQ